jgi:hypothetical protein
MPLALPLRRDALRLVAASWAARLSFVLAMPAAAHSVDVDHWIEVSNLLAAGINPYGATTYLNWPPVWMQLAYVIGRATTVLDVPFLRVLQVFLIGVESVLMVFVLRLVRDLAPDVDAFKVVLFGLALNPVAILLVCQHGNFDVLLVLWVVLFLSALLRFHRTGDTGDWLMACLSLGLGVLTKAVPFVLAPLLAHRWRSLTPRMCGLEAALLLGPVVLGLSVIYALAPEGVTANVLAYRSIGGWFGVSGLLRLAHASGLAGLHGAPFNLLLLSMMLLAGRAVIRRADMAARDVVLIALLLMAMIPALGPGYGPSTGTGSFP